MTRLLGARAFHLGWAGASALALAAAAGIDPYTLALAAAATLAISLAILAGTLLVARPSTGWALAGLLPTIIAFARLASIRWA